MKLAIITCGMLPIPAVQGGAVENLIDFYLEYNNTHKLHDITVYSPWDPKVASHLALASDVNHYIYIEVHSLKARIERRLYNYTHFSEEYYNYFIEYYFEKAYADLKKKNYSYIILENCDGYAYKLSQRGYKNIILHMHNERRLSRSTYDEKVYSNIKKIVTVSDYIKRTVPSIFPKEKIQTVYNGINLEMFFSNIKSPICRKNIGVSDNDFVIVYSGRINKEKGISELIEVMHFLKDYEDIKLLIIGGTFFGDVKNEDQFVHSLKERALDIENKCFFTGFIPYSQVPIYLQLADIAVLPSMWEEPFGMTVVEAMASGLPLITTRTGGIPEICEGVATIVERKDIVNNLTSAIIDLYEHPQKRVQMSVASKERAKIYDKEIYAKNFLATLNQI